MACLFVLLALLTAATAVPRHLPDPSTLALVLNEEEFEDYLDVWLEMDQMLRTNTSSRRAATRNGDYITCNISFAM